MYVWLGLAWPGMDNRIRIGWSGPASVLVGRVWLGLGWSGLARSWLVWSGYVLAGLSGYVMVGKSG